MRRVWLEYKSFIDARDECRLESGRLMRARNSPSSATGSMPMNRCDLSHVVAHDAMHSRSRLRPLLCIFRGLVAALGALPMDYVTAMEVVWSPGVTLRLGDIFLIRDGVPVFGVLQPVTARVAVCIGQVPVRDVNGLVDELDELYMSYRVTSTGHAVDVSYKLARHKRSPNGLIASRVDHFRTYLGVVGACIGGF